jgi:Carboxypeptidase regulatory-like domain
MQGLGVKLYPLWIVRFIFVENCQCLNRLGDLRRLLWRTFFLTMGIRKFICIFAFCFSAVYASGYASGQLISAPEPQAAGVTGTVTDVEGGAIPGATISVDGPSPGDHHKATADGDGYFTLIGLHPSVSYHATVTAKGFADWTSPVLVLTPGQESEIADIKLTVSTVQTVDAVTSSELAVEQIKAEEQQRVLGIIPNFYVSYDPRFVPLSTKLKYKLAFKTSTDVVTFATAIFLAGINQAGDTPDYVQGAKGYGQRVGAAYADAASDIMIGGAVLPSLLHQDPRYFYQGTGTTKSRVMHALASPFIAKGDNGREEFNYSSIGGDFAAAALTNVYYPPSNRGPGLVFSSALTTTGGRMISALAQEFILSKFTSRGKDPK